MNDKQKIVEKLKDAKFKDALTDAREAKLRGMTLAQLYAERRKQAIQSRR